MLLLVWTGTLCLLTQGCVGHAGTSERGCKSWDVKNKSGQSVVCCKSCHPGNRMVMECGPSLEKLCAPCDYNYFTTDPTKPSCSRCTECVGALQTVKACTSTSDTVCVCKPGFRCSDARCSHCMKECGKGQEPANGICRKCPSGKFNDQVHQTCKPWSQRCPSPTEFIVANGSSVSDIKCNKSTVQPTKTEEGSADDAKGTILMVVIYAAFITLILIIIVTTVIMKYAGKRKKAIVTSTATSPPIVRTPTDDPRTLIAVECSFHDAEQEQGGSSETLTSEDSKSQLVR